MLWLPHNLVLIVSQLTRGILILLVSLGRLGTPNDVQGTHPTFLAKRGDEPISILAALVGPHPKKVTNGGYAGGLVDIRAERTQVGKKKNTRTKGTPPVASHGPA